MDLEMVLNELSLEPPAPTVQQAQQRMIDFLDTARMAIKLGVKNVIRTSDDLSCLPLAPNYLLVSWRNDDRVDRDTRRFFKTLLTKSPYLKDIEEDKIKARDKRSQFSYEDKEAKGLGTAYLLEALALSFKSDQCWERSSLELTLIELDEQGELLRDGDVFSVNHACSIAHTQHHANWIKERIHMEAQLSILDGNDIWIQRETLFPHLQFCAAVQKQLQSMRRNDLLLQPIFRKLVAFDTLCANWHDGSFLKHNTIPHISPESDATLQKYKNEHTFVCPDGISRLFSLHARFTPNAGRIYFYVDEEKKTLTIGHIGHKLPNIQYPT